MRNFPTAFFILCILLSLLQFSCRHEPLGINFTNDNDRPNWGIEPIEIPEDSIFNCLSYENFEFPDSVSFLTGFHKYANVFLFAIEENFIIKNALDGDILMTDSLKVNKFVDYNSKLILCSDNGIYQLDDALNYSLINELSCRDMAVTSSDELLFITYGDEMHTPDKIYKLDTTEPDAVIPYTQSFSTSYCDYLSKFTIAKNDTIWAVSCRSGVVRFQGMDFMEAFDWENSPIKITTGLRQVYILPYEDGVILVGHGYGYIFQLLKYTSGTWFTLKEVERPSSLDYDFTILIHTLEGADAIIIDDQLYFIGSDKNIIFRFNVDQNEELTEDKYVFFRDPQLSFNIYCGNPKMYQFSDDEFYFISGRDITRMDCL